MTLSSDFATQLHDEFGGRFRIRWSDKMHEFQLEQKVMTGQIMPPPLISDEDSLTATARYDTYDDNWIRARDGYFYVMSLRNGDRMPCPICGLTVPVPVLETRESVCEGCKLHGRDGRYVAAFYPFNHLLLEHLHDIDPLNGGPIRVRARMRAKQLAKNERMLKADLDVADYHVINNRTQVEGNGMVGYGPKMAPARIG
jgi:hypothetical protein